jgi:aminoglycoside phosphotransferase (APT) family kinase protein
MAVVNVFDGVAPEACTSIPPLPQCVPMHAPSAPADSNPDKDYAEIIVTLRQNGLVGAEAPRLEPLSGGVSSELVKMESDGRALVVKRALAKLRVADDWYADISRNRTEQSYLRAAGRIVPGCVPEIYYAAPEQGWFAMEHLGGTFANWKALLLRKEADPDHARRAGEIIGRIHRETRDDPVFAREFSTPENFTQLRLEPYFDTTARRVPDLELYLQEERMRLAESATALVHGDFSPKNILVSPDRMVLLDAEVGWFGDPAFDTAFLLTHLLLKGLLHSDDPESLLALVPVFWDAYSATLNSPDAAELEARNVRLLLCLMLARVHGKSPVEYLPEPAKRDAVTGFARRHLPKPPPRLAEITGAWRQILTTL